MYNVNLVVWWEGPSGIFCAKNWSFCIIILTQANGHRSGDWAALEVKPAQCPVSSQCILHDHLSGFITLFNCSSFLYKEANDEATVTIEHKTEINHNNFKQTETNNSVNSQADKALGNKKRKKNVKINLQKVSAKMRSLQLCPQALRLMEKSGEQASMKL